MSSESRGKLPDTAIYLLDALELFNVNIDIPTNTLILSISK